MSTRRALRLGGGVWIRRSCGNPLPDGLIGRSRNRLRRYYGGYLKPDLGQGGDGIEKQEHAKGHTFGIIADGDAM